MADPMGAAMYNYYANGVLESSGTSVLAGPMSSLYNFIKLVDKLIVSFCPHVPSTKYDHKVTRE